MYNVKEFLGYLFGTATGGILAYLVLGASLSLWTNDPLYLMFGAGVFLLDRATMEKSNIVVVDKEQFQKQQESDDDHS